MVALFGVHEPRQLARLDPDSWLGKRRLIALDLIGEIERLGNTRLRETFFWRFIDHRGASKRTYCARFDEFDALAVSELRNGPTGTEPVHVLDVAVSDGSTTLSLIDRLEHETGGRFRLTATDLDGRYFVLRPAPRSRRRVIATAKGDIVQIVLPPFVFGHPAHEHFRFFPVNRLMRERADAFARGLIARWRGAGAGVFAEPLLVGHPEFRARLDADRRLAFTGWNILEPWPGEPAHLLRAMNVLNPAYFSLAEQTRVFANLHAALFDGGVLAVGSNENAGSTVDGSLYRRRGAGLVQLLSTGAGCRFAAGAAQLLELGGGPYSVERRHDVH